MRLKNISFEGLKRFVEKFDWLPISEVLNRKSDNRGKKSKFAPVNCFRAFLLGTYLEIEDDTELARRISQHVEYLEFCGVKEAPSHDVLTDFRNNYSHLLKDVFYHVDDLLERMHAFDFDSLSCDGTNINVQIKNKQKPHRYHFGAKSDKEKFHGFWLMLANSVKHQVVREFDVAYAREGQIRICKEMLDCRRIDESEDNFYFFLDGIFDCEEIYDIILRKQGKLPIIGYNKRGSSYEVIEDLPEDNWRFQYNPLLHFPDYIYKIYRLRDSSERVNSHSKSYTLISRIANKVRKCHTILKGVVEHIVTFTFILEQFALLTEYESKLRQKTLCDFF